MADSLAAWLDVLRCPADGSALREGAGALTCPACQANYPANEGVVQFVQADGRSLDHEEKVREMAARDAEAPVYDAMFDERTSALEIPPCIEALAPAPTDVVCELGAGTGRFTVRYAGQVARLVALDFSFRSLQLLRDRLPESARSRVLLVQADACRPPLAPEAFDKVASYGMLQHLPEEEMRAGVVRAASRLLRRGGTFTCSAYNWSKGKRKLAARGEGDYVHKQGHHRSGIFYHNFEVPELTRVWEAAGLRVDRLEGLQIGFRGAGLLGPMQVTVNRLLKGTRWGIERSHQVLVRGVREE